MIMSCALNKVHYDYLFYLRYMCYLIRKQLHVDTDQQGKYALPLWDYFYNIIKFKNGEKKQVWYNSMDIVYAIPFVIFFYMKSKYIICTFFPKRALYTDVSFNICFKCFFTVWLSQNGPGYYLGFPFIPLQMWIIHEVTQILSYHIFTVNVALISRLYSTPMIVTFKGDLHIVDLTLVNIEIWFPFLSFSFL